MAPEQAEGKRVDARSDIFSFGSVLYEMVTGRRGFSGETRISTLSAILHKEPPPLEDAPPELGRIIARCLRKDPARRTQAVAGRCSGSGVSRMGARWTARVVPGEARREAADRGEHRLVGDAVESRTGDRHGRLQGDARGEAQWPFDSIRVGRAKQHAGLFRWFWRQHESLADRHLVQDSEIRKTTGCS
jgi:hypothetical protein